MSLQAAIQRRDLPEVMDLINSGAEINDGSKYPPLYWALDAGIDYVRPLVENGADVNVQMPRGSALRKAANIGNTEVVRLLVSHGADVNFTDPQLGAPLHGAMYTEADIEIARILLDNGADVNIRTSFSNSTPLIGAASSNSLEKVKLLINHGADPNIQERSGTTALHMATWWGDNPEIVKYLVEHGARTDIRAGRTTPEQSARQRNRPRSLEYFNKLKEARRTKFYVDRYVIGREQIPGGEVPALPDDVLRIISDMAGTVSFGKKLDSDIRYLRKFV